MTQKRPVSRANSFALSSRRSQSADLFAEGPRFAAGSTAFLEDEHHDGWLVVCPSFFCSSHAFERQWQLQRPTGAMPIDEILKARRHLKILGGDQLGQLVGNIFRNVA
jgi:hypothetical protein